LHLERCFGTYNKIIKRLLLGGYFNPELVSGSTI